MIPKTHYLIALGSQKGGPVLIRIYTLSMLSAIQFNYEPTFRTTEIDKGSIKC
jgi:hypothetical protein